LILVRRLARGGLVGILVTAAFIATFGLAGIAIYSIGIGIVKFLPWIALSSGIVIIGIGIAKIFGRTVHMNMPPPTGLLYNAKSGDEGRKELSFLNYFLFGIGYSIASLSCTLPLFLFIIFQALSAGGIRKGSIVFLSYALAMGSVMITISLVISTSNRTFVRYLKKLAAKMNIIMSVVLILGGSYLIYYNLIIGKLLY
jgi:cytochrome c biogenesis protein CcdA